MLLRTDQGLADRHLGRSSVPVEASVQSNLIPQGLRVTTSILLSLWRLQVPQA